MKPVKEDAKKRNASRKLSEDEKVEKMFGVPIHQGELVMNLETEYGLAYIHRDMDYFNYIEGSFPYLYGMWRGMSNIIEHQNEEIENDDQSYLNSAFFLLDEEDRPKSVIESITIPAELAALISKGGGIRHNVVLRDLWNIDNEETPTFDPTQI